MKITDKDMNVLKEKFLAAEIFEGKSFWQVEKDLIWVDEEAAPILSL